MLYNIGFVDDLKPLHLRLVNGCLDTPADSDAAPDNERPSVATGTLVCLEAPGTSDHKPVVAAFRLAIRGGTDDIKANQYYMTLHDILYDISCNIIY